jgi:uncharacterized protein (TIGR03437 family)
MVLVQGLVCSLLFVCAVASGAERHPAQFGKSDPGGVLRQFTVAAFGGSGQTSIQAAATDAFGNVYIAGTTGAPDFPVRNAAQPVFGDARIQRSTDLGATWKPLNSPPSDVGAIVPDPAAPQILFAGGASGIYKSTDRGVTWRLVYPFSVSYAQFNGQYLVIDPGNPLRLAATVPGTGNLIRSLDGGETWAATGNQGGLLTADPTGSGALIAGNSLSRDWGATFQRLTAPGPGYVFSTAFDPSHRGWIYADTASGVVGHLYLSTDFGATWTEKASPNDIFSAMYSIVVDPGNPNVLVGASPDGLFVSADAAASWAGPRNSLLLAEMTPLLIPTSGCAAPGALFATAGAGPTAAVAFSPDYGATWQTPRLSYINGIALGPGCTVYAARQATTDAFVAKVAADGTVLWATYLGGSDQDQAIALAVDQQGNVYVTGNTLSADFPATTRRIGASGQPAVFATKLSAAGAVLWSALLGGQPGTAAVTIAADSAGAVYLAGRAGPGYPTTQGALVGTADAGSYTGFLTKLNADASLAWSTLLGAHYTYPGSILVDASGAILVAGTGSVPGKPAPDEATPVFVMKLDRGGTQVLASTYVPGSAFPAGVPGAPFVASTAALATDRAGNLLVFGTAAYNATASTGAYDSPAPASACASRYGPLGNAFVTKLAAADWKPLYTALLRAPCGIAAGGIAVDAAGAPVLAMATGQGLPLRSPLLAGPDCPYYGPIGASAVARLSPDGSQLLFATYLDNCGLPAIALAGDGSMYAGVTASNPANPAGVLRLTPTAAPASLDGVANAFSSDATAVSGNGLYTLAVSGIPAAGIGVTFDGIPAHVVQSATGRILVEAPRFPTVRGGRAHGFTLMQVTWNGGASNRVWVPLIARLPGLMTKNFPDSPAPAADAYAINADGTVNDAGHPAAVGSKVTVFATGLGSETPPLPLFTSWDQSSAGPPSQGPPTSAATVAPAEGSLPAVYQMRVPVTANLKTNAQPDANGVVGVRLWLQNQIYYGSFPPPLSNMVVVYIQ